MNWSIWYLFFLTMLAVYSQRRRHTEKIIQSHIKRNKRKGRIIMSELLNKYIGLEVIITTISNSVSGKLTKIENGWAEIETGTGSEMINLEYVTLIKEYPRNKKGKKSSVRALFEE